MEKIHIGHETEGRPIGVSLSTHNPIYLTPMKKTLSYQPKPPFNAIPMINKTPSNELQFGFKKSYCFGSVITPTTEGSCILLKNGLILTSLHVIFDLKKHGELCTPSDSKERSVEQYYAPLQNIQLQFVQSDVVYTLPVANIVKDGRRFLYHQRVDETFGWDFALLQPSVDILNLLGPGLDFDQTDYTYGRSLLTDNPENTFFVSRPIVDTVNMEFTQSFLRGTPTPIPGGPLSLHGDDPTPKIPSYSGGVVLTQKGQIYQIKNQRDYSLYAHDVLSFLNRSLPEDTRHLDSYYRTGIDHWGLHLIGKIKAKLKPDKSGYHSIPFTEFKSAVGEISNFSWRITNDDRTIKVWEICNTDQWDFHLSACLDPTGQHITKFHFTLRDNDIGKGRSGFAWFEIEGHNKHATLQARADAGEKDVFNDESLTQDIKDHIANIDHYANSIFLCALGFIK